MNSISKLLTICLLTFGFGTYAQEKFTTYDQSYPIGATYDIQLVSKDKDKFTLYIDAMSLDRLHDKGGIMVNEKQHQDFLNAISEAKLKYEEWIKTAKENNVKELDKPMTTKCKADGYFQYGDNWNFHFYGRLSFDFKIFEDKGEIKHLLLIRTGEMQSSSNQFMKVDGVALVFSSASEIDAFTKEISLQKIKDFINKPKAKDLFK